MEKNLEINISEIEIKEKINKILRQTNLTIEEVKTMLIENNYNEEIIIKKYLGIKENNSKIKSVNQEIYKQIRKHLDNSMNDYRKRNIDKPIL
jgi:DNA-binding transcriptional MerR regulator